MRSVVGLAVVAALLWAGGWWVLRRSLPPREGVVPAGVSRAVEVTFDAKGIPQIWAGTDADAWYAMGWLHASDRLFQMELVRRLARGELAEVFGEEAVATDIAQRRLGFARRADPKSLTPQGRLALERYVAGVNAWMARPGSLPPELLVLRLEPRPWTVEDCLAVAGYQTWFAHQLADQDRSYQTVAAKLGAAGARLTRAGHPWSPPTVTSSSFFDEVAGASGMRITAGSNSWAVSPSRSSTGAALHASDPHLAIDQAPGLWYLAGIHSKEGLDVVGATYAGSPFVVMGHNGKIAFSFTVATVDLVDYYADTPRSSVRETIRVRGEKAPRRVEIAHGSRGVMIDRSTSLHWAGFDFAPASLVDAAVRLQRAADFDEFRRAVTQFGALDANWVYSDRRGNIGYQLGAPLPVRTSDPFRVQPSHDPGTAWKGYRSLEESPAVLNPAEGFVASCNNQIVAGNWPYEIPGFYDPYRIGRARALLETKRTPSDMAAMQLDLSSGIAARWKALAAEGAGRAGFAADAAALQRWDGAMRADSREAALFAFWWQSMAGAVFEDELRDEWKLGRSLLEEALSTRSEVIDDRRTRRVEPVEEIAAAAFRRARSDAAGRTWGESCRHEVRHPLARVRALEVLLALNRGPFPAAGDAGSLNANFSSYDEESRRFRTRVGASMRFVLDWADPDAFTLTGALGQSGHPFSRHYDDFLDMSRRGERWNVPFTRGKVFARKASLLVLAPLPR